MFTDSAQSEKKPSLYIFYGDDGFGMAKTVQTMVEKLGDPQTAELNLTRLDQNTRLEQLRGAAFAMPFLSERRLVVVSPALNLVKSAKNNENLLAFLEKLPESTGLVLVIETEFEKNDWKTLKKSIGCVNGLFHNHPEKYIPGNFLCRNNMKCKLDYRRNTPAKRKDFTKCCAGTGKPGRFKSTISCAGNHENPDLFEFFP